MYLIGRNIRQWKISPAKKYSSVKNFVTKRFFRHFLTTKFLPVRYSVVKAEILMSDGNGVLRTKLGQIFQISLISIAFNFCETEIRPRRKSFEH